LKNFRISNPRGFHLRNAFTAQMGRIEYSITGLFGDPCEIRQIEMDNIILSIEFPKAEGFQNNWTNIGSKIYVEKNSREVVIHRLVLKNITVEIRGLDIAGVSKTSHFDQMVFDEIDSKKGFPTKALIAKIFQRAGLGQYIEELLNPEKIIEEAVDPFHVL
jgi:hypothetical protein